MGFGIQQIFRGVHHRFLLKNNRCAFAGEYPHFAPRGVGLRDALSVRMGGQVDKWTRTVACQFPPLSITLISSTELFRPVQRL
ncbi:hypothetical protein IB211_01144c [Intestinimonas butyriciproducens]|uniref:Uncharacterized protein n=1 Tax=Intestinimonas butyriciproducens TaxID=1297617 RepID=A0A0S2W2H6_9FIRM|nr:hypothetical protein IB211_01144c [Intestinimonas butyriciproducens]